MTNHAEIVERLRADAAALEDTAREPCVGSILLTEAAALIKALAERVRELEGALERLTTTSVAVQNALFADPKMQGPEYCSVGIPWVSEIQRAQQTAVRQARKDQA
jgi:hypothetical protein